MRDNLRDVASRAERLLRELIKAIGAGDVAAARAALDAGADPSGTGAYNVTPLGSATSLHGESARDALTELLLARGADPNDRGPYGFDNRPIFYAAHCGHEAVVRMLLASGGFPRDQAGAPARNSDGSTLLALACTSGKRWLADLALAEGCRADDVDRHGSTALHYAALIESVTPRVGKDTAGLIDLLMAHGAPLEHLRPGDWGTAMHWAVQLGDPAGVRALARHGAQLEARTDTTDSTPLQQGARRGRPPALAAAIELGADTRVLTRDGQTLLHLAAERMAHPMLADAEIVAVLLAAGLDPTAVDHTGKIPLATAATSKPVLKKRRPPLAPSQTALLAALVAATPPVLARKIALPT